MPTKFLTLVTNPKRKRRSKTKARKATRRFTRRAARRAKRTVKVNPYRAMSRKKRKSSRRRRSLRKNPFARKSRRSGRRRGGRRMRCNPLSRSFSGPLSAVGGVAGLAKMSGGALGSVLVTSIVFAKYGDSLPGTPGPSDTSGYITAAYRIGAHYALSLLPVGREVKVGILVGGTVAALSDAFKSQIQSVASSAGVSISSPLGRGRVGALNGRPAQRVEPLARASGAGMVPLNANPGSVLPSSF